MAREFLASQAGEDPSCTARRHGTFYAYQICGCRCPTIKRRVNQISQQDSVRGTGGHSRAHYYDETDVEIALARVYRGNPLPALSVPERRAVVARLTQRGWSAARIARATGLAERSVQRYRAHLRQVQHDRDP